MGSWDLKEDSITKREASQFGMVSQCSNKMRPKLHPPHELEDIGELSVRRPSCE